jgi:hypothetical protein
MRLAGLAVAIASGSSGVRNQAVGLSAATRDRLDHSAADSAWPSAGVWPHSAWVAVSYNG